MKIKNSNKKSSILNFKSLIRIVLIDNYDSFTYNIASLIFKIVEDNSGLSFPTPFKIRGRLRRESVRNRLHINTIQGGKVAIDIYYNNCINVETAKNYDVIAVSSGPYTPQKSGNSYKIVEKFLGIKPVLGICLGNQILGNILGFSVKKSKNIIHGDKTYITHFTYPFWKGIPKRISVARYNSLVLYTKDKSLKKYVSSISDDGEIMSIESTKDKFLGVQFHPDSFLSSRYSHKLIKNFFSYLNL